MIIYQAMYFGEPINSFATQEEVQNYCKENSWVQGWRQFYTPDELFQTVWHGKVVRLAEADNFNGCGLLGELNYHGVFKFSVKDVNFEVSDILYILDFEDTIRIQLFKRG